MSYIGNAQSFRVEGNVPGNLTVSGNATISGSSATVNGNEVRTLGTSGAVVQVVQGTYSTQERTGSNTLIDTGLTATITPTSSSNKILVFVQQSGCYKDSNNTGGTIRLYKGATHLRTFSGNFARSGSTAVNNIGTVSGAFLDSPATTSAVTYKTMYSSVSNSVWVYVQVSSDTSIMTLMEVVA